MIQGKWIGEALLALFRRYDLAVDAEIDMRASRVMAIGRVDRQTVDGWIDDLKMVAVRSPVSNSQFVLSELQNIYNLLAEGWTLDSVNNYVNGVKRRYE